MARGIKTGGRKEGTPNKTSAAVRSIITTAIDGYYNSDEFQRDLSLLKAKERLDVMEKLTSYVVPKLQSTTLDVEVENKSTIEDKLRQLSKEEA